MSNEYKNDSEKKSSLSQITEEDYKIIKEIIELIKKDPRSQQFQFPVDTEKNPDYLRVINYNPMDLSTIEKKLSNKEYSLVQDVINDIKLIWYNCRIYNYESSNIYQFSDALEKLADKELEKYYIYYDKINKSVNYKEQYEKNIYKEDAFNDPDYLEKNTSELSDKDKKFYIFLYYKIKLKRLLGKLSNEERKIIFNKIKDSDDKEELHFLNKYIELNMEDKTYFKFHIENMNKEDILFLINYITNNFNVKIDENNF
jgi:hypothetical protein